MEKEVKTPSKFRQKLDKFKGRAKKLGLVGLAVYTAMQAPMTVMRNSSGNGDSFKARYESAFGIELVGYNSEIENNPYLQRNLLETTQDRISDGLGLPEKIIIESEDFYKKNPFDQLKSTIMSNYSGLANPIFNTVTLKPRASGDTIEHEFAHIDTFRLKNSGLIDEWEKLATNEGGKSDYLDLPKLFCSRFKGLEKLIEKEKHSMEDNLREGFVSDYARTNVYEDIAEVVKIARDDYMGGDFLESLFSGSILEKKVKLAVDYGLLPEDYLDFARLKLDTGNIWDWEYGCAEINPAKGLAFLEDSQGFLNTHPYSSKISEVYALRNGPLLGTFHSMFGSSIGLKENIPRAIEEAKIGIKNASDFGEIIAHLDSMERIYESLGLDEEASNMVNTYKMAREIMLNPNLGKNNAPLEAFKNNPLFELAPKSF